MTLIITSPAKTVNGLLTKALATEAQALYPVQRQDYAVTDILDSPAPVGVALIVPGTGIGDFTTGDTVYFGSINGTYGAYYIVLDNSIATQVIIDTPYIDDGGGSGVLNYNAIRPNYYIGVEVRDKADTFTLFNETFKYVLPSSGAKIIDLQNILEAYNKSLEQLSFEYFARFTEHWEGSAESPQDTDVMQSVDGFKQITSQGGALMWGNLLRPISTLTEIKEVTSVISNGGLIQANVTDVTGLILDEWVHLKTNDGVYDVISRINLVGGASVRLDASYISDSLEGILFADNAKLLTKFKNPIIWRGWNRTIAYLMDDEYNNRVANLQSWLNINSTDINKVYISGSGTNIVNADLTPRIIIDKIIEKDGYFGEYISVKTIISTGDITSEELFYQVRVCDNNVVCLDWLNSLGGVDQFCFVRNQIIEIESGEGVLIEAPINEDYETVKRTKRRFAGPTVERMTLTADHLTEDQLLALREIKDTESLRVYLTKDGTQFIDAVVVRDFVTTYQTKERRFRFTVIIEFPDNYSFEAAKLY